MTDLAITVVGRDRPGIIADVTEVLSELGLNLTDSTMTLLRGHFAMMLVCAGPRGAVEVDAALRQLTTGGSLVATVREIEADRPAGATGAAYVLTVHGADRLGIVAAVTRVLAGVGGNITNLTTRLAGELYLLVAEVDLPSRVDVEALATGLRQVARGLGVEVSLRPADADLL